MGGRKGFVAGQKPQAQNDELALAVSLIIFTDKSL